MLVCKLPWQNFLFLGKEGEREGGERGRRGEKGRGERGSVEGEMGEEGREEEGRGRWGEGGERGEKLEGGGKGRGRGEGEEEVGGQRERKGVEGIPEQFTLPTCVYTYIHACGMSFQVCYNYILSFLTPSPSLHATILILLLSFSLSFFLSLPPSLPLFPSAFLPLSLPGSFTSIQPQAQPLTPLLPLKWRRGKDLPF